MKCDLTIPQLLFEACTTYADKPAFSGLGQVLSYADLARLSDDFASYIQHCTDLKPGDRIALQLPNLIQYPILVLGALKAGLIVVNTNPLYTVRELEHQFNDAGVKALVVASMVTGAVAEVIGSTNIDSVIVTSPLELGPLLSLPAAIIPQPPEPVSLGVETLSLTAALNQGALKPPVDVALEADDIAVLQYTGGTTGVSKGAMLSHSNITSNARQTTEHMADIFRPGLETTLCPLPLYHIYAFTVNCIASASRGGHSVLVANPRDLSALVREIQSAPLTGFVGLNTLFNALLHFDEFNNCDLSSLRSTNSGGMALTSEIAKAWKERTGIQIAEGYGLTETSPVISSNSPGAIQTGTVGLPVPGTEVKTIDSEGNELLRGEVGELCARGPQVMQGYWQRPEATAQVLDADGWLKTGDMAVIQGDGYVKIVDRKKDMIIVSGFNVYPNEIEDIAGQFKGVLECAAIGVPDNATGEAVKLYLVADEHGVEPDLLLEFLRTQLTAYKVPKVVEFIDSLPKSNVGKILRKNLRQ